MDDKTMLERAARAAGIDGRWTDDYREYDYQYDAAGEPQSGMMVGGPRGKFWNPLTDDGDALRLAVKLSLCVRCFDYSIIVDGCGIDVAEREIKDRYAATRRAIVRAAAAIAQQAQQESSHE